MKIRTLFAACALLALSLPAGVAAQAYSSIGGGIARAYGDYADEVDTGFTVRGQAGLSLLRIVDAHLQTGWTRFSAPDDDEEAGSQNLYHVGVGARAGVGVIWIGLNGAYFFGDGDDGIGYFPEVGVGLGPIEAVADIRIDGDQKWWALRAALRF